MEEQRLSDNAVLPSNLSELVATIIEPDLSKRPHHGDELLDIIRRIAANEGQS